MTDFSHFSDFIPKAIAKYSMNRQTRAALVCERFRNLAPSIVGEDAMDHIQTKFFKHGILYLWVPSSMWAQHVYVRRHDLIMKLNLNLEKDLVKDIRAHVGKPSEIIQ